MSVDIGASSVRRAIIAGIVGNVMEWYDFAIYGYFATVIGRNFFPAKDASSSLIAAFGVFAAGFLMRPLGSLVFGHIGDKLGRKLALTISVMLMAVPTFLIGVLPTYQQAGWPRGADPAGAAAAGARTVCRRRIHDLWGFSCRAVGVRASRLSWQLCAARRYLRCPLGVGGQRRRRHLSRSRHG